MARVKAMSLLDRVRACNRYDRARYRPFRVAGLRVGWIDAALLPRLARFRDVFAVADGTVDLHPALDDFKSRTAAVEGALRVLRAEGLVRHWRDERYPVAPAFGQAPLFAMERAAVPLLGVSAYGVHLNGYVRDGHGLRMWIGRRSLHKPTYPGMLDNMVAGGQPIGLGLRENLLKEAWEEAGIPAWLASGARPVGAVSYCCEGDGGLRPDTLFIFDLALPSDFVPVPRDGEIESFSLWPMEKVIATVRDTEDFKFNCNLVIIDFLIRHGLIGPEERDYLALVGGLHR